MGESQAIVELVFERHRLDTRHDRVLRIGDLGRRGDNGVFAIGAAVTTAEELDKFLDVLRIAATDAPVQADERSAPRGQPLQRRQARCVLLNPPGPFGQKQDNPVGPIDQLRPGQLRPGAKGLIGVDQGRLDSIDPIETFFENRESTPPPSTAEEVQHSLGDALDLIVDAGPTPGGQPSTVIDVRGPIRIVRDGGIERGAIAAQLAAYGLQLDADSR